MIPIASCCALITTLVSSTVVLLFMAYGWWPSGETVDENSYWGYCEKPTGEAPWIAQVANTTSNIAFAVVGLLMALSIDYHFPKRYWQPVKYENLLTQNKGYGTLWACLLCFIGPASTAMHASFTRFGVFLDQSSLLINASFLAGYCATRKCRSIRFPIFLACYTPVFVAMFLLCFLSPSEDLKTAAFALLVAMAGVTEVWYKISYVSICQTDCLQSFQVTSDTADPRYLVASLACLGLALAILYLSDAPGAPLCFPESAFQGHAVWHVLNAFAVGFVFLFQLSVNEETWRDEHDLEEQNDGVCACRAFPDHQLQVVPN